MHGIKICITAPPVRLLLFVDDCFVFCEASIEETSYLRTLFGIFEEVSGQKVNLAKSSSSFSRNLSQGRRHLVASTLGFPEVTNHGKYLGFPSSIPKNKNECFAYLKERVCQSISGWETKFLSQAGRLVLLKSVASAIPLYVMSAAYLPDDLCDSIEKMMNSFLWKSSAYSKGLKWMAWENMTHAKEAGGLGLRTLRDFNLAMLAKQGWRLLTETTSLSYRLLKAKYFQNKDFLHASIHPNDYPSFTWSSIMKAQHLIRDGC